MGPALLELSGISKSFGGVQALRAVDFSLKVGEIHGLVGENGAGKSTLMKIIAGVHAGYDGEMRVDGRPVHFRSSGDALAAGIGMVHQELSVAPELTVAENVFLGVQPVIELSRVLFSGARIIILDEPTSALSPPEIERLFEVLIRLKRGGRSIIFISHFLEDILKV